MFIDKLWTQSDQYTLAAPQYWIGALWSGLLPKPHRCFEPPEGLEWDLGTQLIIWLLVSHLWPHSVLWCCLQRPSAAGWWFEAWLSRALCSVAGCKKEGNAPSLDSCPHEACFLSRNGNNCNFEQRNYESVRQFSQENASEASEMSLGPFCVAISGAILRVHWNCIFEKDILHKIYDFY